MNGLFKFCILLFLCFCFKTGVSQESFQKHTVSDGETIASIAKKYLVTAFELQQANPGVLSEINVNDVLNIPQTNINATQLKSASDSIRASIVSGPTEYTVKSGDTKFSLARRFGLTIKALEARNPHSVPTLQEGQILNVPNVLKKESHNNLESYVVTKFDTKFGLAKKFNTTIPELERINPNIVEMLLIGQTVKIPSDKINVSTNDELPEINTTTPQQSKTPTRPTKKPIGIKTSPAVKEAIVTNKNLAQPSLDKQAKIQQADDKISKHTSSKYANLTGSLKTSKQKKLLFFLPFSQSEFQTYNPNKSFDEVSDRFKKSHLEFYKGANIAIDSLRKMKLKLEVDIVEAKNNIQKAEIKTLVKLQQIASYDGVILPFYDTVDEELAAIIAAENIPVISASPVAIQTPSNNLYSALPSANLQRQKTLDYIRSQKGTMILISDVNRKENRSFIAKNNPQAIIIDLDKNGTYNNDDLIGKLKKNQVNYVILDSERNSVFINTTNILLSESSNYTIQIAVLESNLIPDKSDVSVKRYQILKMLFPSFAPAQTTVDTNNFTAAYLKKYNTIPTANVLLGFDITMDTLLRLAQEESFQNSAENQVTEYTHLKFDYKKNAMQGYDNQGIYILHYDTGSDIKEVN